MLRKKYHYSYFCLLYKQFYIWLIRRKKSDSDKGKKGIVAAFNMITRDQLHSNIIQMFYSTSLPFHLARNSYYVSIFIFATNNPLSGYLPSGYNLLRITLIQK